MFKELVDILQNRISFIKKVSLAFLASTICGNAAFAYIPTGTPAPDPFYIQEWHLGAMNVPLAWKQTKGRGQHVGMIGNFGRISTFCTDLPPIDSLSIGSGYTEPAGFYPTEYATVGFALANNGINTAGIAPEAHITQCCITGAALDGTGSGAVQYGNNVIDGQLSDAVDALLSHDRRIKIIIVNLDQDFAYPDNNTSGGWALVHGDCQKLYDPAEYPRFHRKAQEFYNRGGLIFANVGDILNSSQQVTDYHHQVPYINLVASTTRDSSGTGFGNPATRRNSPVFPSKISTAVTFSAPAESILVSDARNQVVDAFGISSVAATEVAAVASLVWAANPRLSNRQVRQIMIDTAFKPAGHAWDAVYGHGVPNAGEAVSRAVNLR